MQTIEIRNIGPLVETGIIPVSQVMLLIGEQSTGKSTFMKILCFCCWLEKQVMIGGDSIVSKYTHYYRFWNELKKFHHFNDEFLSDSSYIKYDGSAIQIEMRGKKRNAKIVRKPKFAEIRHNLKISFLPSERNLLSSIQNIENLYRSKDVDMLFNYILEWGEARLQFGVANPLDLVFVDKMKYHYDAKNGDVLTLTDGHSKIKPYYASSGVQSALPIQVLATYLAGEVGTSAKISPVDYLKQLDLTDSKIDIKVMTSVLKNIQNRSSYKSFHMFIEELEQNLFPKAQFELVKMLVGLLKKMEQKSTGYTSTVFLTTHSPYVLTALNVMMLASAAYEMSPDKVNDLGLEDYVLPKGAYSAYCIKDGRFENIVDEEFGFIKGDFLDSVSELVDNYTFELNSIIYGNTEG
ncbi:ATP-binding protein [uncultured Prevotella sp.]|uniref:ATP-binding protein n=1 Tax=uncultured Prevotella sp. TaxID=159272 RepID=UPI00260084F7|nr:ATP-binding protein [uncultured Prevotella sp.]